VSEKSDPFELYAGLSTPAVVTDADYHIVYLNRSAEAFWQTTRQAVMGQYPRPALRLSPPDQRDVAEWAQSVGFPALTTGDSFTCMTTDPDGRARIVHLSGTRFLHAGELHMVLTVLSEAGVGAQPRAPAWALLDPLTGLHNRHEWEREFQERNGRSGVLVFFDLDGLKEINDLNGHRAGDQALAITGRALAAEAPDGALVVRYGGDEFVMVVDAERGAGIAAVASRVVARAAEGAQAAGMPLPLHLSFGISLFGPGGLEEAVQRADDALYEQKGVLMRGADAGRIVLTRLGRNLVRKPGSDPEERRPETYAARFGPEFDSYFRQAFARAVEQAREFVEFIAPRPGQAAVEVGAGSGRIAFDGGLAERIGATGQLLLTDPSSAQLQVARKRAHDLGVHWVRFLQAPVEDLPLASGTVDLVFGSTFLHFTDPVVALRSMARVLRPGGSVAVNALLELNYGGGWDWATDLMREELRVHGRPLGTFLIPRAGMEAAFEAAGLRVDRVEEAPEERGEFPSADIAIGVLRQVGYVRLFLRGVPDDRIRALEQVFEARIREAFGQAATDWSAGFRCISVVAHRAE